MRLFVYGTLLSASGTAPARRLHRHVARSCPASVPGRLFAIRTRQGCFPALVPPRRRGERVTGALCHVLLKPADVAWLDRYEGAEYRRLIVRAATGTVGRGSPASVYRWCAPLPPGARRIAGGDFLAWLAATGQRAYAAARDRLPYRPRS